MLSKEFPSRVLFCSIYENSNISAVVLEENPFYAVLYDLNSDILLATFKFSLHIKGVKFGSAHIIVATKSKYHAYTIPNLQKVAFYDIYGGDAPKFDIKN